MLILFLRPLFHLPMDDVRWKRLFVFSSKNCVQFWESKRYQSKTSLSRRFQPIFECIDLDEYRTKFIAQRNRIVVEVILRRFRVLDWSPTPVWRCILWPRWHHCGRFSSLHGAEKVCPVTAEASRRASFGRGVTVKRDWFCSQNSTHLFDHPSSQMMLASHPISNALQRRTSIKYHVHPSSGSPSTHLCWFLASSD
jgi:hypothetical protein